MTRRAWIVMVAGFLLSAGPVSFARKRKARSTKTRKATILSRPQELRGSKQQRVKQNIKAENLGIGQILTAGELLAMADDGRLVGLKSNDNYYVDRGVSQVRKLRRGKRTIICPPKENKVFVHAFAVSYIDLLAHDFFHEFGRKLKVTSGARSLEEQILMRTRGSCYYNSNAALASDPLEESLHVRAIAFDISRRVVAVVKGKLKEMPMSRRELDWMRKRLIADKLRGVEFEIEPLEENGSYHIVVFSKP